jgi:hypothetical protein
MSEHRQRQQPSSLPQWRESPLFGAPVLITGVPRSGTSLVTGLLGLCGLWLGDTVPGGRENIRGFFENKILREKLQKELLRSGGFDPLGVNRLPPPEWQPAVENCREFVCAALAAQRYEGTQPWGFKDAKLSLTWRVWHQQFPQARWIIVRRRTDEIVASCLRTSFMQQHSSDPAFWHRFVDAYLARLEALQRSVPSSRTIGASDVAAGRFGTLQQIVAELGLAWDEDAARAFVEPAAWHAPGPHQSEAAAP